MCVSDSVHASTNASIAAPAEAVCGAKNSVIRASPRGREHETRRSQSRRIRRVWWQPLWTCPGRARPGTSTRVHHASAWRETLAELGGERERHPRAHLLMLWMAVRHHEIVMSIRPGLVHVERYIGRGRKTAGGLEAWPPKKVGSARPLCCDCVPFPSSCQLAPRERRIAQLRVSGRADPRHAQRRQDALRTVGAKPEALTPRDPSIASHPENVNPASATPAHSHPAPPPPRHRPAPTATADESAGAGPRSAHPSRTAPARPRSHE